MPSASWKSSLAAFFASSRSSSTHHSESLIDSSMAFAFGLPLITRQIPPDLCEFFVDLVDQVKRFSWLGHDSLIRWDSTAGAVTVAHDCTSFGAFGVCSWVFPQASKSS
jgi:hypothetical protein